MFLYMMFVVVCYVMLSRVLPRCSVTFDDDDARGLVAAVAVGRDAGVLAAVLGPAVHYLECDDAVRVRHRVVELG